MANKYIQLLNIILTLNNADKRKTLPKLLNSLFGKVSRFRDPVSLMKN